MATLLALMLSLAPQSGDLERLENVNPTIRLAAVQLAAEEKWTTAVHRLIKRLEAPEEKPDFKAEVQKSLEKITGRTDLKDAVAWRGWWDSEGSIRFSESGPQSDARLTAKQDEMLVKAKQDIRAITTVLAVAIFLFIIVMFFFVGNVSSKIKGWRELVGRAEIYIKHSQELTERTDRIAAELDAKKAEVSAFLEKLRKEHEEGIARRGEDLGNELAHQLRMDLQTLRQKAERELGQTVTDLKTQLEASARRAASEVRDRLAK